MRGKRDASRRPHCWPKGGASDYIHVGQRAVNLRVSSRRRIWFARAHGGNALRLLGDAALTQTAPLNLPATTHQRQHSQSISASTTLKPPTMAAPTLSPRRDARTPARSPRVRTTTEAVSEPPHKKRRYIPGGPGGGGRWLDENGKEASDTIDFAKTAPRPRPSRPKREHSLKPVMEDAETPARSAVSTRPRRERTERYPPQATPRPRYSNAAAAAAASCLLYTSDAADE